MGVKFKCNQSGNIFEFFTAHDIKTMRSHPEYQEIIAEVVEQVKKPVGRPVKAQGAKDEQEVS
jgi:hypothetical protein